MYCLPPVRTTAYIFLSPLTAPGDYLLGPSGTSESGLRAYICSRPTCEAHLAPQFGRINGWHPRRTATHKTKGADAQIGHPHKQKVYDKTLDQPNPDLLWNERIFNGLWPANLPPALYSANAKIPHATDRSPLAFS